MSSKPGAAVSPDEDSSNSPTPSGSGNATGSAGGASPALEKNTAGKNRAEAKKPPRKSTAGKAAGRKPAARKMAPEKKTAERPRKRPGLARAAAPDAGAQNTPAAHADDPRSLAWMVTAANKALNAVREHQAEKASLLLEAHGAGAPAPAEAALESAAGSAPRAITPAGAVTGEVSVPEVAAPAWQEQQQAEIAATVIEDSTLPVAVTAEIAATVIEDSTPPVAVPEVASEAGAEEARHRNGHATAREAEPAGKVPLPPPAVAPRRGLPLRMMAGAVVLAVVVGYGYLADKDDTAVPAADLPGGDSSTTGPGRTPVSVMPETAGAARRELVKTGEPAPIAATADPLAAPDQAPAVVDHTAQAATESGARAAAPAATDVVPHEQPVAAAAEDTATAQPADESPEPVAGQPAYRGPGYGYYPPGWGQPGHRYPAR